MAVDPSMMTEYNTYPEIRDSVVREMMGSIHDMGTEDTGSCEVTYRLKLLVPSTAAEAVIGKGGCMIAQVQKDFGACIEMYEADDFYPGTTEQVCLIEGTPVAIMTSLEFLMEKIQQKLDDDCKDLFQSEKQVKILVPNSTASKIIGKGGSSINQIKAYSGSHIQICQKSKNTLLQDRCITIKGNMECNRAACRMILEKVIEDLQSRSTSCADIARPVSKYSHISSPYMNVSNQPQLSSLTTGAVTLNSALVLSLNLGSPFGGTVLTTYLMEHIILTLQRNGYSEEESSEIIDAMKTLANYGILRMTPALADKMNTSTSVLTNQSLSSFGNGPSQQIPSLFDCCPPTPQQSSSLMNYYGRASNPQQIIPIPRLLDHISPTPQKCGSMMDCYGGVSLGGTSVSSKSKGPTPEEEMNKETLEISESITEAIFNQSDMVLATMQQVSGATITVSERSIFMPDISNRIITIEGTESAIKRARYMIQLRIESERIKQNEEETKK